MLIGALALFGGAAHAQPDADSAEPEHAAIALAPVAPAAIAPAAIAPAGPFNEERILGVLPDYQTITDPGKQAAPLTRKQKWSLVWKETADPFNIFSAAMGAGFSQIGNQTPKYGRGAPAFGERFGAALGDFGTQNLFSAGLLASIFHQDPRYFRKGPESHIPSRVLYSISRIVIARQDSGKSAFNISGIGGLLMGIGASNLYYPSASVRGSVMVSRLHSTIMGSISGNLLSEFWPDVQRKFLHRKHPRS
jgi:hypothetical protein